ncbi:hypothetical protein DI005_20195 [Prauserella sp. PE36]|uniref:hypothetical protein n=1 Tax=Prauserella sp. PE36 TaxID=1504709 RepID=UPI000DE21C7B|nr:hypothetical protein [Prauserella sp. PE36]RBM18116.1 hypothetical protein DI005_20195 [Prauserella sp. PE36]
MTSLDSTSSSPRRRPTGWIVLAVLLVATLGVGAYVLGLEAGESTPDAAAPPSSAPAGPDTAVPTSAPADTRWELYQGFALPSSPTHGPSTVDGALASGYARTPTGALLASVNVVYRLALAPGQSWRAVAEQQVVGDGKQAFIEQMAGADRAATSGLQPFAGFKFLSYDGQTAVIGTAVGTPGNYTTSTVVMRWVDGDWRFSLTGTDTALTQQVSDLTGYIAWGG